MSESIDRVNQFGVWQPIETAPLHGRIILTFAETDTETGNWSMQLSWWRNDPAPREHHWSGWASYGPMPTHWMPLPPPPDGFRKSFGGGDV